MKATLLTFSQTGNTLKVGNAIAAELQKYGISTAHTRFLHRKHWQVNGADILGFGSPVFENRPAECVPEFLSQFRGKFVGKKAFVYITSEGSPAKSLWRLAQSVETTGADVIGGIQITGACTVPTMFGFFNGRPNEADLNKAAHFGKAVSNALLNQKPLPGDYLIDPQKGGRFYDILGPYLTAVKKKITPPPEADGSKCDCCGICAYECPVENIAVDKNSIVFKSHCIVCYRCWNICPKDAVSIRFSPGSGWIERTLYSEPMERLFGSLNKNETRGPNLFRQALSRQVKLKYNRKTPTAEFRVRTCKSSHSKPQVKQEKKMKKHLSEPIKSGLFGGVISGIISALLNFFLLPFPATVLDNAIGHGIGGFFCGFISAFMGVLIFILHHRSSFENKGLATQG